jgi:hypothetical protein
LVSTAVVAGRPRLSHLYRLLMNCHEDRKAFVSGALEGRLRNRRSAAANFGLFQRSSCTLAE